MRKLIVAVLGVLLVVMPTASGETHARVRTAPRSYSPPPGPRFNLPTGDMHARRRIIGHLIRTIDSVPPYQKIRIASWNLRSDDITDALVRAHERGVSVRVVVDHLNANPANPNGNVRRLRHVLSQDQEHRRPSMRSEIRLCRSSCRGPAATGIAHTKFYLFSRAGTKRDVVMYGSANATDLAAVGQWNDLFTLEGKPAFYRKFNQVFDQMLRDRAVAQPYQTISNGPYTAYFYPYVGQGRHGDPVLDVLHRVQCGGATNGTGVGGHTSLRLAMTAMHGPRGQRIAKALRHLWEQGCNMRIIYAVFGNNVLHILKRGKRGSIPIHHIVNDYDGDGVYERYLHMKDLTISGNYDGKPDADVTFNGTANWTGLALASDEVVMRIYGAAVRKQYSDWIDYVYFHPPPGPRREIFGRVADQQRQRRAIDLD